MVEAQKQMGGFLPEKSPSLTLDETDEAVHAFLDADDSDVPEPMFNLTVNMRHQSLARPALRPLTLGNWMFDVVADLTANKPVVVPASVVVAARDAKRVSRFVPTEAFTGSMPAEWGRRPSSFQVSPMMPPQSAHTVASRRFSLQFTPTSPTFSNWSTSKGLLPMERDEEGEKFEQEKCAVERSGSHAIGSCNLRSGVSCARSTLRSRTRAGPLTFTHVGFAYPERVEAPVPKDVNLRIEEGECVAIVGPSGAGKSTIALLQRLYAPDVGTVSIGANDIASMNVTHLRHHISVISQNPNLFDTTIAENIRHGNQNVSEVDIRNAAKAAHVHEFVMSLPCQGRLE